MQRFSFSPKQNSEIPKNVSFLVQRCSHNDGRCQFRNSSNEMDNEIPIMSFIG